MAFSLSDWIGVIRQERRRLSSLVSRARKAGTDVSLADIAGDMPRPTTVQEAKEILAEYKVWQSYHDVVSYMNQLDNPVRGYAADFEQFMNIPVPESTPDVVANELQTTLNNYYSYMSTTLADNSISSHLYQQWWQMLNNYFTEYEIAQAIKSLTEKGISYEDISFGSDWQAVQEANDYMRRVMQELKNQSSADDLAADDAIAEWTNIWEDIESNKQSFYAEWYQSRLI